MCPIEVAAGLHCIVWGGQSVALEKLVMVCDLIFFVFVLCELRFLPSYNPCLGPSRAGSSDGTTAKAR